MFQLLEYSVHNLTEENRIQKFLILKKKLLYVYIACLLHNSLLFFTVVQKKLMLSGKRDVDRPREELEEAWGGPSSHAYVTIFDGVHVCRWLASYNLWFADKWIFRGRRGYRARAKCILLDPVMKTNTLGCEFSSHVIQNASLSETRRGWKTYASSTEASVRDYQNAYCPQT